MNSRYWTKDEETILFKEVENSPNNLAQAFRNTSERIGRSPEAVGYKWYTSFHNNPEKANTVYALISKKKVYRNCKGGNRGNASRPRQTFWREFKELVKKHFGK